ncbi:hypothetical protein GCM10017653_23650 [Ancylobacter defluvii]|uniref:Uncharacterized protein n=1 Tax=Ancylobacter defluvii TaxID=1282440 RepID=A0A9W6NB72_9HYPH|nr:hypothetical protein GCM10017653_23650 [Ancylobacter defluvii]
MLGEQGKQRVAEIGHIAQACHVKRARVLRRIWPNVFKSHHKIRRQMGMEQGLGVVSARARG